MEKEELERRANLKPIDTIKSDKEAIDKAYAGSETKPVLETVKVPPKPELDASVGILEALLANVRVYWSNNVVKYFKGEDVPSPLGFLSVLKDWKMLLLAGGIVAVLIVVLKLVL